jgi:dihydroxyacetone kinase-like predicted kinase
MAAIASTPIADMEIVTIYFGGEASFEATDTVATHIREEHPGLAVEVVEGGQPHYPYVVSLE